MYTRPNKQSALDESEFVDLAVLELLGGGSIEKVVDIPRVCSPLSVVCNGVGKKEVSSQPATREPTPPYSQYELKTHQTIDYAIYLYLVHYTKFLLIGSFLLFFHF